MGACDEGDRGEHHDQFVVDVIQGGAGTSTNMNANEVIANLALESWAMRRATTTCLHPNDHVNASQSTNDVYPTAVRLALGAGIDALLDAMASCAAFRGQGAGIQPRAQDRPHPAAGCGADDLGPGVLAFAMMIGEDEARLREARALIKEINLGATAIGTGINAPAGYAEMVVPLLAQDQRRAGGDAPGTWSRRPRIRARSCSSRACSSAWPAS